MSVLIALVICDFVVVITCFFFVDLSKMCGSNTDVQPTKLSCLCSCQAVLLSTGGAGGGTGGSDSDVVVAMVTLVDMEMVVIYYPGTGRDGSGKGAAPRFFIFNMFL